MAQDAAVAAIQFALETDEGLTFLRLWNQGDFDVIRREWPDAPEDVFIGADPQHPKTVIADLVGDDQVRNALQKAAAVATQLGVRKILELTPDQLHEVERGLVLRIAECEKLRARAKSAEGQRDWAEQMRSAETAFAAVGKLPQV